MKKIILIFSIIFLTFLVSCQISVNKGDTDTEKDALTDFGTNTGTTDISTDTNINTDTDLDTEAVYVITVKDQDGLYVSDAVIAIYDSLGDIIKELTTNEEGKAVCSLNGSYFVDVISLPSGYIDDFPFGDLIENTIITVNNKNPNGTEERPYILTGGLTTSQLNPNEKIHYSIDNGDNRILKIRDAYGINVIYEGDKHTPNNEGEIIFILDKNAEASIIIENTSNEQKSITIEILYQRTEMDKAEEIKLHTNKEATVSINSAHYFKWIADRSGMVMVYSQTENNNISLYNKTLDMWSQETDGTSCEYIYANEDDEVYVMVSAWSSEEINVEFAIYSYDATIIDDSIPLMEEEIVLNLLGNQRFYFMINAGECTLSISGDGKLYYNNEEYDISEIDSLQLASQGSGMPIFFEIENTDSKTQQYTITIK